MERVPPPGNQWEHYGRSRQMWQYDISPSHRSVSSENDDDDICVMIKCVFFFCAHVCECVSFLCVFVFVTKNDHFLESHQNEV